MKMVRTISAIVLIIGIGFIGYRYLYSSNNEASKKPVVIDQTPLVIKPSDYNKDDQNFLGSIRKSLKETQQVIAKLDSEIVDAENNDEMEDAQDAMEDARKQILFHWNTIHNGYVPKDTTLQKLKTRYEALLDSYKEGLTTELDGMDTGAAPELKNGHELTNEAKNNLQKLSKEIAN